MDLVHLRASSIEEFQGVESGELVQMVLILLFYVPGSTLLIAAAAAPVLVPLSWFSVVALRWAAGGTIAPRSAPV